MDKSPVIINDKPMIGISACCMGCPVRYNARSYDMLKHIGREKGDFRWVPVCPECLAGLGVMRDPIHIAGENGTAVWQGTAKVKSRGGRDVTDQMIAGAKAAEDNLKRAGVKAFVYMDGSPSCGVYRTTLRKQSRGRPPGVFGSLLDQGGYFLIPALDLQSPVKWWDWRRRLLAYLWLQDVQLSSRKDVYDVWYRLKFICQEIDDNWARQNGRMLANLDKQAGTEVFEQFRRETANLLRKPSTTPKIKGSLLKNYAHYRKKTGQTVPDIQAPDARRNVTSMARELMIMERASAEAGYFVGTAPVLYSGKLPKQAEKKIDLIEKAAKRDQLNAADSDPEDHVVL